MEFKFHEGDTVYAVNLKHEVVKTTVKEIQFDGKQAVYELDLPEKNRFYTEEYLFSNKDEAERAAIRSMDTRTEQFDKQIEANYDRETHTFLGVSGNRVSKYFECSPEEIQDIQRMVGDLIDYCRMKDIPIYMMLCTKMDAQGNVQVLNAASMPGPRTPDSMHLLKDIAARYQELQKKGIV